MYDSITAWGIANNLDAKTLWDESKVSQDYDNFGNIYGVTEAQSNRLRSIEYKYGLGALNLVAQYVRANNWDWEK